MGGRLRFSAAATTLAACAIASAPALAGNGYVNMPSRGCPPNFSAVSSHLFPGFELSDINLDGTVCAMPSPGLIGSDVVVDNTANAQS
jgi:hypothetical protein